jgi:hypothetical protein
LKIAFVGHATLIFTFGGKVIHADPYSRLADYGELPKADVILGEPDEFSDVFTNSNKVVLSSSDVTPTPTSLPPSEEVASLPSPLAADSAEPVVGPSSAPGESPPLKASPVTAQPAPTTRATASSATTPPPTSPAREVPSQSPVVPRAAVLPTPSAVRASPLLRPAAPEPSRSNAGNEGRQVAGEFRKGGGTTNFGSAGHFRPRGKDPTDLSAQESPAAAQLREIVEKRLGEKIR